MCKINLNRLEETDILPFRIGTRKNIKVNHDSWVFFYHYFHTENDPYKLSKRIIENNIGKSFDLAFSYYCSKVEKRYQDIFLNEFKIDEVDLIQINIEGDEYDLLDYMIENKLIRRFKNIQIQFHLNIENCIQRRDIIRDKLLENNFEINFDYPFVWESWKRI